VHQNSLDQWKYEARKLHQFNHFFGRSDAARRCSAMGRSAMNSAAMAVLRGRKVLVVDDIAVNRLLLQAMLRAEGMVVELACDGLQAVQRVESEDFDLVLMDLSMPVMDGYQATRAILDSTSRVSDGARAAFAAPPIIAVTANQAPGERARCLAAGMSDYLTKPIVRLALLLAIARALENGTPRVGDLSRGGHA
jgi:CheY-like chemotaxis protein